MPARNIFRDASFFLRTRLTPAVRMIFVLNVGIFLVYWIAGGFMRGLAGDFVELFQCDPSDIKRGCIWQLFTYSFLHGGPWHLLGNMLFLWFLGPLVEQRIGTWAFWRVYLAAAVVGGLSHVVFFLRSASPPAMIGASGAVMAVCVVCAYYYFDLMVLVWGIFPIRLGYLIIILLVFDALYLLGPAEGHVANYAHLAGAAVGYVYVKMRESGGGDGGSGGRRYRPAWMDLWSWRLRALGRKVWPFGKRSRPKARIRNIFDDDYFRK